MIERLYKKYPRIIKGPDFWEFYMENPGYLSDDGVHPSWPEGLFAYRLEWAKRAVEEVYK
ncbi:MAG TPA: hypothetical protein ENN43_01890 [bacterium]|nr:hypothetical protein [bacterium]